MVFASIRGAFAALKKGAAREDVPVYHRLAGLEEAEEVKRSGELWGAPPRNIFRSDIPCVKAFAGGLKENDDGYEFITEVEPSYSSPYERRWVAGSPGVTVEDGFAKIAVTVTRIRTRSP